MEEIVLKTISWVVPEYNHRERSVDWLWGFGIITFILAVIALFMGNHLFAVFILVGGGSMILFTIRRPKDMQVIIATEGFTIGSENYEWKQIKGFRIKKTPTGTKLFIRTAKHFLPTFTIPLHDEIVQEARESLLKVIPVMEELDESPSMVFMEKIGF
ncbi:MAG: hypothetical protein WC059_03460 [Candidatus Paceibacterota bacterium]